MNDRQKDQIETVEGNVYHKSAGGFVFYEEPSSHELFVALIRPEDQKEFFIPKGHLKTDETPRDAAERELCEELGLTKKPSLLTELGVDKYSFTFDSSPTKHFKEVFLFVFSADTKESLKVPVGEKIEEALWIPFGDATRKIAYDKDNLLKARQLYYFHKPSKIQLLEKTDLAITVGIPTFNGQYTIYKTLESVIASLCAVPHITKKEVLICLDHCSDGTQQEIDSFKRNNPDNKINIKSIENTSHRGKPTAMNIIFEKSTSDLLYFADDDIILDVNCINELIAALAKEHESKCVFSRWIRSINKKESLYRRCWREILGVKFDVQPFKKPSDYLLGGSILLRREDYVYFPWYIANEDQFLQYIYWPKTKKIHSSFVHFNSVNSISDYYRRFIRIIGSSVQLSGDFSKDRIRYCSSELRRKIDYGKIIRFPIRQLIPFLLYRLIRMAISSYVSIRLLENKNYVWRRVKQNT